MGSHLRMMTLIMVLVRSHEPRHSVPTADILRRQRQEPRQVLEEPLRRTMLSTPPRMVEIPARRFGREVVIATSLSLEQSTAPIRLLRWYRVGEVRISGTAGVPAAVGATVVEAPSIAIFPDLATALQAEDNKLLQTAAPPRMEESWHMQHRPRTLTLTRRLHRRHRRLPFPRLIPIDQPERIAMHRTCTDWPGTTFLGREICTIIYKIHSASSPFAKIRRKSSMPL
mmetsp:Transcript_34480/g.101323  ORF Transcript_34480/g.101323 Transcript_34480/m.101323 type:complete len:227 (-) Transcript_34480:1950-2630(-)